MHAAPVEYHGKKAGHQYFLEPSGYPADGSSGPAVIQHAHDAQQRGFSRAGRAHDGDKFALFYIHIDPAQQPHRARWALDSLFNVPELNHVSFIEPWKLFPYFLMTAKPHSAQYRIAYSYRRAIIGSTFVARRAGM
jgi:hypothetical protein